MDATGWDFPFHLDDRGRVAVSSGDRNIRARILQVLLTSPGERVNVPEFGCGLKDLVFDPNNEILEATLEFSINRALQRWIGEDIVVENVDVRRTEAGMEVEVVYTRRDQIQRASVKIAI